MKYLVIILVIIYFTFAKNGDSKRQKYCRRLHECVAPTNTTEVCGVRKRDGKYSFKLFSSKCELLLFGCYVKDYKNAYKIIKMKYCRRKHTKITPKSNHVTKSTKTKKKCDKWKCSSQSGAGDAGGAEEVCGIRQRGAGAGFDARVFRSRCHLHKHNCRTEQQFIVTYDYICTALYNSDNKTQSPFASEGSETEQDTDDVTTNIQPNVLVKVKKDKKSIKNRCHTLKCPSENDDNLVCGISRQGTELKSKHFANNCELLKYNCLNKNKFFETDLALCGEMNQSEELRSTTTQKIEDVKQDIDKTISFSAPSQSDIILVKTTADDFVESKKHCAEYNCTFEHSGNETCGIKQVGEGFKIKLFPNKCELWKYNCQKKRIYFEADLHICSSLHPSAKLTATTETPTRDEVDEGNYDTFTNITEGGFYGMKDVNESTPTLYKNNIPKVPFQTNNSRTVLPKIVTVVNGDMFDFDGNPNHTIDNYFRATHMLPVPLRNIGSTLPESTRRLMIKQMGHVEVYIPWTKKPKNILQRLNRSDAIMYEPLLSSCFHRCPERCPDFYAPVCAGFSFMHDFPSTMFKNHCWMDASSCVVHWKGYNIRDIQRATYQEISQVFCLSSPAAAVLRMLPIVRSLQRMGRLKRKGRFHYQFKNMRNFNELQKKPQSIFG